jgi:hypothetical protein
MPKTIGTVEVNIVGDLLPIARAFGIMSAALAAYGHEFTDEEMTAIATAADLLGRQTGHRPDLDFDIDANLESPS